MKNHKFDKIANLVCILISIPGSIAGPVVFLKMIFPSLASVSMESADSSFSSGIFSFFFETKLFNIDLSTWSYFIALAALVISTCIVQTIWKMFRAGGKAFVTLIHAPVIVWIFTLGTYLIVPTIALFVPLILGFIFPVAPILICTLNKQMEWDREA